MAFGTVTLNDGHAIPAIAYGTGSKWKQKSVVEYVATAIDTGFSHIDTAQRALSPTSFHSQVAYISSEYSTEPDVGQAIRESGLARSDFFVTTKFGGGEVQEEFNKSLNNLGLKQVDLYLIHFPTPRIVGEKGVAGTWLELEKIRNSGRAKCDCLLPIITLVVLTEAARSIGVSNFQVSHLESVAEVSTITPAVNQIHLHPYNYAEMKPVLQYCAAHGIVVEAYSSLDPITKFPGGPVDAPLVAAASRRGATPVQALFLWVRAKGVVIVTTSSTKAHMEEYLAVGDLEPLTPEEVAAIDEAGKDGPPPVTAVMLARRQLTALALWRVVIHMILAVIMLTLGWKTGWLLVKG
ncbi:Aldo/keto reductase [Schizophyllum commune H4-8]|uniref:NADP-dependent oxidoreductase domain-containing protein n=1 Tax=Schizophyllum commune (strain H4-8 / FGSC 9210) TaxID=578458 RepID=D8PVD1_SCHCM|nr:Aldo/keto reductase [Schizophyllum commune H4-8]KAI5900403.1 Aldo/keto reductase [Schizophyllum commune H4-8]